MSRWGGERPFLGGSPRQITDDLAELSGTGVSSSPTRRPPQRTGDQPARAVPEGLCRTGRVGSTAGAARNYLLRPRIVKEVGRTFDANPNLTVSDLLEVLRQDTQSQLSERLRGLFQSLLIGVPKEGRRPIAMMKPLPYVAYDTTALATLTGWSVTRTDACLADPRLP
jgi:hypothetical protein